MRLFKIVFPSGYQVENIEDDNTDINIILCDGTVFFSTFFTLKNIQRILDADEGVYFWATDMVILRDLERTTIVTAVQRIIEDDYLDSACSEIGKVEDIYLGETFDSLREN